MQFAATKIPFQLNGMYGKNGVTLQNQQTARELMKNSQIDETMVMARRERKANVHKPMTIGK